MPRLSRRSHLWVAPDERVSVAEVFLGRLVAGVGGPARFHVTANGCWVGAPAEEVDETKPRPLSLSRSSQTPRRSLGCLVRRLSDSHSALWSIRGMNELTKAADVTSELGKFRAQPPLSFATTSAARGSFKDSDTGVVQQNIGCIFLACFLPGFVLTLEEE